MNDEKRPDEGTPEDAAAEEPTAVTQEQPTPPRRLLRSSQDRVLAGVSGGLGTYFGVDPLIFRIGFGLSIFFGGLGILAYLLLAVFVPRDDDPDSDAVARLRGGGFWRGVGLVVVGLLVLGALLALAGGAGFAVAVGWGVPVAIVAIAAGALLLLAAFRGGARWLIPPAVAIALGASIAAASEVDFSGGIGERDYRPVTEASIPADGYRLGVGELVIDLRQLEWKKRDVLELETSMGAGLTAIYVPERVCVTADVDVGAGNSVVAGERNEGFDVEETIESGSTATPRLELDSDLDFGELWVINSDTAAATGDTGPGWHGHDWDGPFGDDEGDALRAAEARACATE